MNLEYCTDGLSTVLYFDHFFSDLVSWEFVILYIVSFIDYSYDWLCEKTSVRIKLRLSNHLNLKKENKMAIK